MDPREQADFEICGCYGIGSGGTPMTRVPQWAVCTTERSKMVCHHWCRPICELSPCESNPEEYLILNTDRAKPKLGQIPCQGTS